MWIYLSARYSRKEELMGYSEQLDQAGHEVCSTWIKRSDAAPEVPTAVEDQVNALADCLDLNLAEALICFTETPRKELTRGGRHVEFGIALGKGIPVVVVGPRENIFHHLPWVHHLPQWGPEVIQVLGQIKAQQSNGTNPQAWLGGESGG